MNTLRKLTYMLIFGAVHAAAQTSTTYTLPAGTECSSGPETCYYELVATPPYGVFISSANYNMQFQYRDTATQNPGYDAEYCNGIGQWTQAATPLLGQTAAFFIMDCGSHNLTGVPSTMHAEIQAHSYVKTYTCGGRVRTICHQTVWVVDEGTLTITK